MLPTLYMFTGWHIYPSMQLLWDDLRLWDFVKLKWLSAAHAGSEMQSNGSVQPCWFSRISLFPFWYSLTFPFFLVRNEIMVWNSGKCMNLQYSSVYWGAFRSMDKLGNQFISGLLMQKKFISVKCKNTCCITNRQVSPCFAESFFFFLPCLYAFG